MDFDTFDRLAEDICSNCCAGNDLCGPLTCDCPFQSEFEALDELCKQVDSQAQYLAHAASNYNLEAEREFYAMDDWR